MPLIKHIQKMLATLVTGIFFFSTVTAQNFVPNGSFEILDSCHYFFTLNISSANYAPPWDGTLNNGTPDIFLACNGSTPTSMSFGYQAAQQGGNYIGMLAYEKQIEEREYVSVRLIDTLTANQAYYVGYYVSLANRYSDYEVRKMGAYLADTLVYSGSAFGVLPFVPQIKNKTSHSLKDTMNWVLVADTFFAAGNEKYLAVGNFYSNPTCIPMLTNWNDPIHDSSAYYYIDNVFVYEIPGLILGEEEKEENRNIILYPNPSTGEFTISSSSPFRKEEELSIFDINGKLVYRSNLKEQKTNLILTLSQGVYYYTITTVNKLLKREKIVIIN
jgi:hypothetical protein